MTQPKWKTKDYSCRVGGNIVKPVTNTEGENSDDDEQEDELQELYMHTNLQSEYNWVALDEENWQEMLKRAHLWSLREARVSEEEEGQEDGEQGGGPRPEDKLWEIGCQVWYLAIILGIGTNYHVGWKGGSGGIPLNAEGPFA
jgi:hypothetical protein